MLKIFIGPNGYGKTYELERIKKSLFDEDNDRKDIIMLGSELVFADEMKDTVNNSFLMDYIITELLVDDELINLQKQFENKLDTLIKDNSDMYNELMDETLDLNSHKRTKDVIAPQKTREYKKLVKINADDLKACMGSGQKLHFLLKLIEKSNKRYIFLDEPENHSHPSMLNITANLINKLSETKDVYIATHSPELLNMLNIDFNNSYIFNDPECKGSKTIDFKKAANDLPSNINIENLYSNSKTYYDEEKLKNNILDIHKKEFMSALFSNKVYIVEGINDQLFLKKVLNSAGKQFEQYSIFPCYGKPHYFPFIEIFKDLGIDVVLLFDEDKTSDETNNKINTELQKNKHYMFSEILEKEIGYNGDKGNLSKFLDYLTSYNGYEKYFSIVED